MSTNVSVKGASSLRVDVLAIRKFSSVHSFVWQQTCAPLVVASIVTKYLEFRMTTRSCSRLSSHSCNYWIFTCMYRYNPCATCMHKCRRSYPSCPTSMILQLLKQIAICVSSTRIMKYEFPFSDISSRI